MKEALVNRRVAAATALLATFALAACHPKTLTSVKDDMVKGGVHVSTSEPIKGPVTVADRLDCPQAQGELRRTAQAADGRSCAYTGGGRDVELSLLDGAADPQAALAPVRAGLDALMPAPAGGGTIRVSSETRLDGKDRSKVDMPFLHVSDDGKTSHVKILGMTIDSDSDDHSDKVRRHPKNADDDRAPGGVEQVYVLAGGGARSGLHAVGYVARGGLTGPLVVGVFKSRDHDMHGDDDHDLDALIDLNAKKG